MFIYLLCVCMPIMHAHVQADGRVRHPVAITCGSLFVCAGIGMLVDVCMRPCIVVVRMRTLYCFVRRLHRHPVLTQKSSCSLIECNVCSLARFIVASQCIMSLKDLTRPMQRSTLLLIVFASGCRQHGQLVLALRPPW